MYRGETEGGNRKALPAERTEPEEAESEISAEGEDLMESLNVWGARPEEAMRKSIDDWDYYQKMLFRFSRNPLLSEADVLYLARDWKELYRCVHEIRGSAGMLGLMPLYRAAKELTGLLGGQRYEAEELPEERICEVRKSLNDFDRERDRFLAIMQQHRISEAS